MDATQMTDEQLNAHVSEALLENAVDYVRVGCDNALTDTPTGWKYAVLHTFAGIELLLKARLAQKSWRLVVKETKKKCATAEEVAAGDFYSVGIEDAQTRLRENLQMEMEEADSQSIKSLQKIRNKIQHFGLTVDEALAKSLAEKATIIFLKFTNAHFSEMDFEDVREKAKALEGYVEFRMHEIRPQLDEAEFVLECPECQQEAVVCADSQCHCKFCGGVFEAEKIAREEMRRGYAPGDDVDEPYTCPECENKTCFRLPDDSAEERYACATCGERRSGDPCSECNDFLTTEEGGVCHSCWSDKKDEGDDFCDIFRD